MKSLVTPLDAYRDKLRDRLALEDGTTAEVVDDAIELRDGRGRLMVRYADGHAEIHAPSGDLTLAAPGRVVLRSGSDVKIDAARNLDVEAQSGEVKLGTAKLVARQVATSATTMVHHVERYQLKAERVVEQAREAFRDVREVLQMRVGRMRTLVREDHTLHAKRNVMVSKEETKVDGERILLG